MEFRDFFGTLKRHLGLVLLCALLGAGAGQAVAQFTPKTYMASTQTFYTVDNNDITQSTSFTEGQLKSYAAAANSDLVLSPVAKRFGKDVLALSKQTSISIPTGTSIIEVDVEDSSPQQAADLANAISEELQTATATLSPSAKDAKGVATKATVVKSVILTTATAPTKPSSPNMLLDTVVGLALGLLVGIAAALVRGARVARAQGTTGAHVGKAHETS
ncbi:YveK family protein [Luteococcus sanguinis]|uniref:YveK family protein n=1 Tax=Luteococcus sanguinis TaxID=174038 RepID=A0ABW1X6M4_9ACTN